MRQQRFPDEILEHLNHHRMYGVLLLPQPPQSTGFTNTNLISSPSSRRPPEMNQNLVAIPRSNRHIKDGIALRVCSTR